MKLKYHALIRKSAGREDNAMMLMQAAGSHPRFEQDVLHGVEALHLSNQLAKTAEAFGRVVTKNVGVVIVGALKLGKECNPVLLADKYAPGVEKFVDAGRYLKFAAYKGAEAFNRINPVAIAIRNGPWYISQPLQFSCDELNALTSHLSHPVSSALDLLEYFSKKPSRIAKLLRAAGVNVPEEVMAVMKMEEDWDKAQELLPIFIRNGIDPVKALNKDMARLRGKVLLTIIKASMGDKTDLSQSLEKLAIGILETAGTRVMARTVKEAIKDKPTEKSVLNKTTSISDHEPETEDEGLFFDALDNLGLELPSGQNKS